MDGKQVAILVPTTVLARQHYQTAVAAVCRGFPVNIDVLQPVPYSREAAADDRRKLRSGAVDLDQSGPISCCKRSVEFKDLGLLIVDEEQRFGVTHKERLKEICARAWTC